MHAIDKPDDLEQVFAPGGAMEAILKAKQQGKIRNIGFSCHRERSALYLMNQFDFDTVLHPINFLCMIKNGKGELLIKQANKNNMGIIALKTLALRPYNEGESKQNPITWYYPITDEKLAQMAMRYTANKGNLIMISPGLQSHLDLMVKIINENPGLPPLDESELQMIKDSTKDVQALFSD